jgi:thioester reductase-like protein
MVTSDYKGHASYLLTGSTGVLGGRLLLELLLSTHAKIYCMIRDENLEEAHDRIKEILNIYDPKKTYQSQYHRVTPVYGTLTADHFGMQEQAYLTLMSKVQSVFHCAAKLSLIDGYEKLSGTNVQGTARIADFCLQGNIPLLFTSSFSMIGDKLYEEGFSLKEDQYDYGQGFEDLGYEKTKFKSEQYLNNLKDKGLQVIIVRPGNIWGDSENGCYPIKNTTVKGIYYEMIRTLIETGHTIYSKEDFDVTPVDYVAKACLYFLSSSEKHIGKTFNLVNPIAPKYNDIVNFIREAGYQVKLIPDEDYFSALSEKRMVRGDVPYESIFTDILLLCVDDSDVAEYATYETSQAEAALVPAGIQCPVASIDLFRKYFHYCVQIGWIPSPENQNPAEITQEIRNKIHMEHLYDTDL